MLMSNKQCIEMGLDRQLYEWLTCFCKNCPFYAGIANDKVCNREVQCLSDKAFEMIRKESLK